MASRWREWLADRFGTRPIRDTFFVRRVPKDPWYFGDGMTTLMLLMIQVGTGIFLTLGYSPAADKAYDSVRHITTHQMLGWFVRGLHYWSGGLMVVMVVVHLFRQIAIGGYKHPREGTWLIGVLMFVIVITTSFLGYVLRWDERAIYGLRVSLHMFHNVPVIGDALVRLVQGGPELSTLTLTRIYAMHVIFLPLLLLSLVGYHVYLVVLHGTTSPTERTHPSESTEDHKEKYERDAESEKRGEVFYPHTMARLSLLPAVLFGLAVVLTLTVGTRDFYPEANLTEPSFPMEEWWFAWYSALIALLPPSIAPAFYVLFPVLVLLLLLALPFIDRGPSRGVRHRPIAVGVVLLCVVGLIYLSGLRWVSPWTGWPDPEPPSLPQGIVLTEGAEQGRLLFARYGCNSCHAIAGDGRRVGPDLTDMRQRYSRDELRRYILSPPPDVAMPPYEGRITEEDLARIVEFVLVVQTLPSSQ